MKTKIFLFLIALFSFSFKNGFVVQIDKGTKGGAMVDFDAFEKLTSEVKEYRKSRLIDLEEFLKMSKETNTLILDTRSTEMYNKKHIKSAVHLNFSDFTYGNLLSTVKFYDKRILIYCNNNFVRDEEHFATKMSIPPHGVLGDQKSVSLALNIPTFINLYGYGFKNVYELSDLVDATSDKVEFEGTDVSK